MTTKLLSAARIAELRADAKRAEPHTFLGRDLHEVLDALEEAMAHLDYTVRMGNGGEPYVVDVIRRALREAEAKR